MKKLSVIIPVYNEEKTLKELVDKVISVELSSIWYTKEIILINDWSKDKSEDIINQLINDNEKIEIIYIKNKKNSGKWFSLKEWFKVATWEAMLVQDADLEYFPEKDYLPMLKVFEEKNADIVYWSRTLWTKKFNNNYSSKSFLWWWLLVSFATSILLFRKITDEPTCYKMYRNNLKKYLIFPKENRFEREPAATMLVLRKWGSYYEVPIHYHARKFTEGKKIKRYDWVQALRALVKWRFIPIPKI